MITQIATVAIYVDDQQAALSFWTEKVGFEVRRNEPMGPEVNWIEVAPQDTQTGLVIYAKSMMPDWEQLKPSIVFQCWNIQGTYQKMLAKGINFIEEPKTMPWGTYATFVDPDGNEYLLKE